MRMLHLAGVGFMAVLIAACATSRTTGRVPVPQPFPRPEAQNPEPEARGPEPETRSPEPEARSLEALVVDAALALRGTPYRNGGSDPTGFDCSGFTQYVFARFGVLLPRDVRSQFEVGSSIAPASVAPGDLVFFTTTGPGATHVGVAIGNGDFVHAPSSNGRVRVESLGGGYWSRRFVGARRMVRIGDANLRLTNS